MKFNKEIQDKISEDINIILKMIPYGIINSGFAQKVPEQRMSQEIETYVKNIITATFEAQSSKCNYLVGIEGNNGSSKAPYELLFLFRINGISFEVFVDFKPINVLKESTAPFMGSINKYIDRLEGKNFYDVFMIVEYESEVDKLPKLNGINLEFVKDITNYSLYNNWQLQLSIKNTQITYGREPKLFQKDLIQLLQNMKTDTVKKIISRCEFNIEKLQKIKL